MKKALLLFTLILSLYADAQTNKIDQTGDVGIGTITPYDIFHVRSGANSNLIVGSGFSGASQVKAVNDANNAYNKLYLDGSSIVLSYNSGGNVGIGTTTPIYPLDVQGIIRNRAAADASPYTKPRIMVYGGEGVDGTNWGYLSYGDDASMRVVYSKTSSSHDLLFGTTSAMDNTGTFTQTASLNAAGNFSAKGLIVSSSADLSPYTQKRLTLYEDGMNWGYLGYGADAAVRFVYGNTASGYGALYFGQSTATNNTGSFTSTMALLPSGNVGIGTNNPSEKLAVNGNIKTKKIIVTQLGWPDYVFHSTYNLRTLSSLETFIKKNKHLPDVPSANEVAKNGLDMGATQAALLRKIEELTLYVIDLSKENATLKLRVKKIENRK